jgi:hypothetical protein
MYLFFGRVEGGGPSTPLISKEKPKFMILQIEEDEWVSR